MPMTTRTALTIAIVTLIAACGGAGSEPSASAPSPAAASAQGNAVERLRAVAVGGGSSAAAAVAVTITNAQFFQWVGQILSSIFPPGPVTTSLSVGGLVLDIRAYTNGNYLAVASNGDVYALGPITGNALVGLGPLQAFAAQVCAAVDCPPVGTGGTGTVNDCTMNADQALQTGNTFRATYVSSTFLAPAQTSEYSIEGRVDGPATFEGQSVIKTTTTTTAQGQGGTSLQVAATFTRASQGGLFELLGTDSEMTINGLVTRKKSVYTPPVPNSEFGLQQGGTLTKTKNSTTTTTVGGSALPPSTAKETSTFKFEARETITVLGRSYATCRYRETDSSGFYQLQWHIVGHERSARFEQYMADGTLVGRFEMKSGSFNGVPL